MAIYVLKNIKIVFSIFENLKKIFFYPIDNEPPQLLNLSIGMAPTLP